MLIQTVTSICLYCRRENLRLLNPLKTKTVRNGFEMLTHNKRPDGINKKVKKELKKEKNKTNIWAYAVGLGGTTSDRIAFGHPAVFPEKLAEDHILSWSNIGDLVFDPMVGSGTTCKMAALNNRKYLGVDISGRIYRNSKTKIRLICMKNLQKGNWALYRQDFGFNVENKKKSPIATHFNKNTVVQILEFGGC